LIAVVVGDGVEAGTGGSNGPNNVTSPISRTQSPIASPTAKSKNSGGSANKEAIGTLSSTLASLALLMASFVVLA
jgi:hypothetical protein